MKEVLSPIQNHIISRLKNAHALRYRDMQPAFVPNDLFNYHLQFLVKKGFVERSENGYALSEDGIQVVADSNVADTDAKIASVFKFNVITIVSRIRDGQIEILNQLRKSHPSYGKVGVPGGVVYKGEALEHAASRKLKEETGLDATFRIVGIERRFLYVNDSLFSDVLFPIAYSKKITGDLLEESEFGKNFWVSIDQAIKNEATEFDSITSIVEILTAIKNDAIEDMPFFYRENTQKQ